MKLPANEEEVIEVILLKDQIDDVNMVQTNVQTNQSFLEISIEGNLSLSESVCVCGCAV